MLQNPVLVDPTLAFMLQVSSGFFWTLTYILIIRRGYLDKTYGMPLVAICANISWEFIFSFIYPHPKPQLYIDYLWLLFDVGILTQYLKYGKQEFRTFIPETYFFPAFFITWFLAALFILFISKEFNEYIGIYAAFGQNFIMSVLFIHLFFKRDRVQGQSMYIALSKLIGTVFPSILFYHYFPYSSLLLFLFTSIFIFDLLYFLLLFFRLKYLNINPWVRV